MVGSVCQVDSIVSSEGKRGLTISFVIDLDLNTFSSIDERCIDLFGFAFWELKIMGIKGFEARIHPDDREILLDEMIDEGDSDFIETIEYRFLDRHGKYVKIKEIRNLIFDGQGIPIKIKGIYASPSNDFYV